VLECLHLLTVGKLELEVLPHEGELSLGDGSAGEFPDQRLEHDLVFLLCDVVSLNQSLLDSLHVLGVLPNCNLLLLKLLGVGVFQGVEICVGDLESFFHVSDMFGVDRHSNDFLLKEHLVVS